MDLGAFVLYQPERGAKYAFVGERPSARSGLGWSERCCLRVATSLRARDGSLVPRIVLGWLSTYPFCCLDAAGFLSWSPVLTGTHQLPTTSSVPIRGCVRRGCSETTIARGSGPLHASLPPRSAHRSRRSNESSRVGSANRTIGWIEYGPSQSDPNQTIKPPPLWYYSTSLGYRVPTSTVEKPT